MKGQISLKVLVLAVHAFAASESAAQVPLEIYQNPSNLQVLPPDIAAEELRDVMSAIGQQVGIRCSQCHDFDLDLPIDQRDYASDAKALKRVTRAMMRMVDDVNASIAAIDRGPGHTALTVQCFTCHRGVSQPRKIEDIFTETTSSAGVAAAIGEYKELREIWFATSAYDFSAWKLGEVAQSIADTGNVEGGMQVHALNLDLNSDDGSIYYHRAETYEKRGLIGDAISDYQRALEMEPDSLGFLEDRIAMLRDSTE